jgi:acetamidase/formamidase
MKMKKSWKPKTAAALLLCGAAFGVGAYTYQSILPEDALRIVPNTRLPGTLHILPATMETTQWGWFNNAQPPVMYIESGDTVIIETMMHSHNQLVPGKTVEELKKLRTDWPGRGPMTLTGPIYINGAEPGDVLKVKINKIVPRAYGANFNLPGLFGQFPTLFPDGQVKYFYLDWDRKVAEFGQGIEIPLRPFPGTLGVARAEPGQYNAVPPGPFAGNLDNRDLVEGTTLYVPVFVPGALLWSGDSHAAQGNGEVNLTAIETAFKELNVTVEVIKGRNLEWPLIETPDDWITMGFDPNLNLALSNAKAETVKLLAAQHGIATNKAEQLMLKVSDCRVTQVVDIKKGVHCLNPIGNRGALSEPRPDDDTPHYLVTVSHNSDLNLAMDEASWAMIEKLQAVKALSRLDAYSIASIGMDCRLDIRSTPTGVHCVVPKSLWVN